MTPARMSKRSLSATALMGFLAIAAAVAVAATTASSHHAAKHTRPAVSQRLARVFRVLGRHELAHSASADSQSLPIAVSEGMSSQSGVDPSEAVYAGGQYPTWVVPGASEVCLVAGAIGTRGVPSSVCGPSSRAESGLVLLTETDSGQPVVLGLVPNGNSSITVTETNGTSEDVPVANNVFEITKGHPDTVSLKDASGKPSSRSVAISPPPGPTEPAR